MTITETDLRNEIAATFPEDARNQQAATTSPGMTPQTALLFDGNAPEGEYAQARLDAQAALNRIEESVERRFEHLLAIEQGGPDAIRLELAICEEDELYWLRWYGWTYDPRNPLETPPLPAHLPFDLCQRQEEMWNWFNFIIGLREDGAVKKSRGTGFTWQAGAWAWYKWRFRNGFKTTFGSRKATEVDQIGNPDSIFEKIRLLYRALPRWMWPAGFNPNLHDKQMLLINPLNGNTIRGEGGDEMGRGGRSTVYIIDEAAVLEHADRVEAATSGNADVRIWGSTINHNIPNNLFAQKYNSFPPERVFRFHYSQQPIWTPERIRKKKDSMAPEVWAAEFEIDDSFTVEDICIPAVWVQSAIKLKSVLAEVTSKPGPFSSLHLEPRVQGIAGGDVGGGKAQSVVIARFGPIICSPKAWNEPDTIDTALKMLDYCTDLTLPPRKDSYPPKVRFLRYDSVAIGQGVSATMRRNPRVGLTVTGVNVGDKASDTKWPDGEEAYEKFFNAKAEGWWTAREAFKRTHEMVLLLTGQPGGVKHDLTTCLSLPDDPKDQHLARLVSQLSLVKWTRREDGRILIESKVSLAARQIPSPDYADALILTFTGMSKAEKLVAWSKVNVNG